MAHQLVHCRVCRSKDVVLHEGINVCDACHDAGKLVAKFISPSLQNDRDMANARITDRDDRIVPKIDSRLWE